VQAFGALVSAAVAVAAGYFALTTYMDSVAKQVDERKAQVFNLHARFNSEPLFSIRKRIYGELIRDARCKWDDAKTPAPDQNDKFAFVEFFDVLDVCVSSKLCDADLIDRMFVPYANGHWEYLRPYILGVRRGEAAMDLKIQFGVGLERMAPKPFKITC
jgi:hypothetical protein